MRAILIALIVVAALLLMHLICGIMYVQYGWFKALYHDIFGWHEPDESKPAEFDGVNWHCTCKYCNEPIMQDSQGNWF